jgi:methylenetetrahydrofolate--tRNA-(uracil-5-)-methyltransferase
LTVQESMENVVRIIGGGLAGAEAAWQLARRGISVELFEMRPQRMTEAHAGGDLGRNARPRFPHHSLR